MMTKSDGNGSITVVSNPPDPDSQLLHLALLRTEAGEIKHHSGAYGPVQGWDWRRGVLRTEDRDALDGALDGGLIAICAPAVEDADPALVDSVQWLRLIHLGSTVIKGNPVAITFAGQKRLAAMKPRAVLAGAA